MAAKTVTFRTFDGNDITVRVDMIAVIREPGRGLHDYGEIRLTTGAGWAFGDTDTAKRIKKILEED